MWDRLSLDVVPQQVIIANFISERQEQAGGSGILFIPTWNYWCNQRQKKDKHARRVARFGIACRDRN